METTFQRHEYSSALLNTDDEGLKAYKTRRENLKKIQQLEMDINTIKQEMHDIKLQLQQIINRG
jgi:hypothetical protein